MDLLIRNATIIDRTGNHHRREADLLIRNGVIERIDGDISAPNVETIDAAGACVSAGWMDIGVQTGDPGYEHREDLPSAAAAAAAGGFTAIACQPNTNPAADTKSEVLYVRNRSRGWLVDCYPIGAVSKQCAGQDITEMVDMYSAGAVAFSDGKNALQDSGLMMRSLQYVTTFDGVIINQPLDGGIAWEGQMHEGLTSTSLGLKGIPGLAEELMVQRDLELLAYTGSRLHLANISTAGSVRRIREAKAEGLRVTCSVSALSLSFLDTDLQDFDTNLKVLPPLRSAEDQEALLQGLCDGTIDMISANHVPLEEEVKKLEFPFAKFGAVGLETAFAAARTALGDRLPLDELVACLAHRPRRLFGLEAPRIAEGQVANLTLFDPDREWTLTERRLHSRSRNTPWLGRRLRGAVLAVVNHNQSAIAANP